MSGSDLLLTGKQPDCLSMFVQVRWHRGWGVKWRHNASHSTICHTVWRLTHNGSSPCCYDPLAPIRPGEKDLSPPPPSSFFSCVYPQLPDLEVWWLGECERWQVIPQTLELSSSRTPWCLAFVKGEHNDGTLCLKIRTHLVSFAPKVWVKSSFITAALYINASPSWTSKNRWNSLYRYYNTSI